MAQRFTQEPFQHTRAPLVPGQAGDVSARMPKASGFIAPGAVCNPGCRACEAITSSGSRTTKIHGTSETQRETDPCCGYARRRA